MFGNWITRFHNDHEYLMMITWLILNVMVIGEKKLSSIPDDFHNKIGIINVKNGEVARMYILIKY